MTDKSRRRRQAVVDPAEKEAEGMQETTDVETMVVVAMLYLVLVATVPKSRLDKSALSKSRPSGFLGLPGLPGLPIRASTVASC